MSERCMKLLSHLGSSPGDVLNLQQHYFSERFLVEINGFTVVLKIMRLAVFLVPFKWF